MTKRPGFVAALSLAAAAFFIPTVTSHAVQNPPAAQTPPAVQAPPAGAPQGAPPPGQGRGGRGGPPGAAVYAQFCASCHGPKLEGAAGPSLVDDVWTNGSDDKSIATIIRDGKTGTPMIAFKDMVNDEQIRQLVYYLRDQYGQQKGKPETKVDPEGAIIKSEKQTVKLEVVAKDLETPWGIAFLPDGRLLITERPGRLRILEKGKLLPPVKGTPEVWVRQDGGLFDVEVHPQYAKTGWIYLWYSEPQQGFKLPTPDPNAPPPAAAPGGGRGGPPSIPSMTVDRARQDQGQHLGRAAGAVQRCAGAVHDGELPLRIALHVRQGRSPVLLARRQGHAGERAGSDEADRQGPSRER